MSRITRTLIGAGLAVLINAVAAISLAATPDTSSNLPSIVVHYNDLSLEHPGDVKRLYHRIGVAADSVCGVREIPGSHLERPSYRNCFDTAVSNAVAAVANPALSAYYREQYASRPLTTTLAQR
jgi:UrcA family protein